MPARGNCLYIRRKTPYYVGMITFIRHLIAAPVRLLAWANSFLHVFDQARLAEALWFLTGDAADGANVIVLTARSKGLDAGRQRAEAIFARRPDEQVAAAIGWVEASEGGDLTAAAQWIERCRQAGCEDGPALLQLELSLSEHLEGYDYPELIERILSRNDLPGNITRDALVGKAKLLLRDRQWDRAREIAERILVIEEHAIARWVAWVTAVAAGDDEAGRTQYTQAAAGMRPEVFLGYEALGWLYVGDEKKAAEVLSGRTPDGKQAVFVDRDLADFVRRGQMNMANGGDGE